MDFEKEITDWLEKCGFKKNSKNWNDYEEAKRKYYILEEANPNYYYHRYNDFIKILTNFLWL